MNQHGDADSSMIDGSGKMNCMKDEMDVQVENENENERKLKAASARWQEFFWGGMKSEMKWRENAEADACNAMRDMTQQMTSAIEFEDEEEKRKRSSKHTQNFLQNQRSQDEVSKKESNGHTRAISVVDKWKT